MHQRRNCNLRLVSLLHLLVFLWATFTTLSVFNCCCNCCSNAKEIDVTEQWTLVGENDTIPAGVHVRMDLSTGEKWVKLLDNNDNHDEKSSSNTGKTTTDPKTIGVSSTSATAVAEVKQISTGGGLDVTMTTVTSTATSTATAAATGTTTLPESSLLSESTDSPQEPLLDYEMMYRTLSQLPDEEKERMGGIPELPGSSSSLSSQGGSTTDPVDRQRFEARMKEIWLQRQEELKSLSEELVADMPALLKDRIQRIHRYLENPYQHLLEMNDLAQSSDHIGNDIDEDDGSVTDIVSVLQDLEYQLSDLDMTRDFYTLGGWPLLVSLLSDSVHQSVNVTTTSSAISAADLKSKVNLVQSHAAWAIGTAVKNTEEFYSFAVEEVAINGRKETPLTLLLQLILAPTVPNHVYESSVSSLVHRQTKSLYGLSCLLRGNRLAQIHFCAGDGPQQLGALLLLVVVSSSETSSTSHQQSPAPVLSPGLRSSNDVAKRLLTLAHDIVTDVELHPGRSPQLDQAIVNSFSSEAWCQAVIQSIVQQNPTTTSTGGTTTTTSVVRDTALQTLVSLAPYCNYADSQSQQDMVESLTLLHRMWEKESHEMDPDHWQERQQLLQAALKLLQAS